MEENFWGASWWPSGLGHIFVCQCKCLSLDLPSLSPMILYPPPAPTVSCPCNRFILCDCSDKWGGGLLLVHSTSSATIPLFQPPYDVLGLSRQMFPLVGVSVEFWSSNRSQSMIFMSSCLLLKNKRWPEGSRDFTKSCLELCTLRPWWVPHCSTRFYDMLACYQREHSGINLKKYNPYSHFKPFGRILKGIKLILEDVLSVLWAACSR